MSDGMKACRMKGRKVTEVELEKAKKAGKLVTTLIGTGYINGVGGRFTYIYYPLPEPKDGTLGYIILADNNDIAEVQKDAIH